MSIRSFQIVALAFAAASLVACASGGAKPAAPAPGAAVTTAGGACVTCNVEVDNRFDYDVLVFDRRAAQNEVGDIKEIGKTAGKSTVTVQTKGRPNLGIAIAQDNGMPHTAKDLKFCRQVPVTPGSRADFRYACGN